MTHSPAVAFLMTLTLALLGIPVSADELLNLNVTNGSLYLGDGLSSTSPSAALYEPIISKIHSGGLTLKLTVARQVAPLSKSASFSSDGSGEANRAIGDATVALTYELPQLSIAGWNFAATAKEHTSTAYQKAQLAIPNYRALQLDVRRSAGPLTIFSSLGYKRPQAHAGESAPSGMYGYSGGSYQINRRANLELSLDYCRSASSIATYEAEIYTNLTFAIGKDVSLRSYITKSVSPGNRSWEPGVILSARF